jgi:hypothetical protein
VKRGMSREARVLFMLSAEQARRRERMRLSWSTRFVLKQDSMTLAYPTV